MLKMYMKRIFINMMAGVLAIGGLCSCEQQAPTVFEEAPRIYFRKMGRMMKYTFTRFLCTGETGTGFDICRVADNG